jgi:hypothetical protein
MNRIRTRARRSRFRRGDLVRVRTAEQIAATLDSDGTLDRMPFMPEMTALCGETFVVGASAHKTCDSVTLSGLRALDAAAHLEGAHCSGSAHGGCQSRCPFFFKDAWLEPAGADDGADRATQHGGDELGRLAARSVLLRGRDPATGTFSCQNTEILEATSPLSFWRSRQYWDDVLSRNITMRELLRRFPIMVFNKAQDLSRRFLPARLQIAGGRSYPRCVGTLADTPDVRLGIAPGERVRIRPQAEVLATLDTEGRNRGLAFDSDMVPYCDRDATVRHRVEIRVDEQTGRLVRMKNPCVVLDGVVCRGHYHRFCPRGLDQYWREAWLERDSGSLPHTDPEHSGS